MLLALPALLLAYVFVTTFTPGPNNITSASMGMNHGYRKALPYLLGIFTGFVGIMFVCGLLTETVVRLLPKLEIGLRIVGSAYMIWLAISILRSTKTEESKDALSPAFGRGVLLQVLNPKVIIYGITVFSGFLIPLLGSIFDLALAAVFFAFRSLRVDHHLGSVRIGSEEIPQQSNRPLGVQYLYGRSPAVLRVFYIRNRPSF